jgi:hypothetical protein
VGDELALAVLPDAVDLQLAHGEGAARFEDDSGSFEMVAGGGRQKVDLVFDGEDFAVLGEQGEGRVAAGAVGDGVLVAPAWT